MQLEVFSTVWLSKTIEVSSLVKDPDERNVLRISGTIFSFILEDFKILFLSYK